MQSYRSLYFHLYAAMADALEALDQGRTELARERLLDAMREGEDAHMSLDVLPDKN